MSLLPNDQLTEGSPSPASELAGRSAGRDSVQRRSASFFVPRANHSNCANLEQRLQQVGSAAMLHDATADDSIHVDGSDFHGFACRLHAQPRPHVRALRGNQSHHPIPLRDLLIDCQVQVRVSLAHPQHMFCGPVEADGVASPTIDFDIAWGDEFGNPIHIPCVHHLFNITTDYESILVCCHASVLRAEQVITKPLLSTHFGMIGERLAAVSEPWSIAKTSTTPPESLGKVNSRNGGAGPLRAPQRRSGSAQAMEPPRSRQRRRFHPASVKASGSRQRQAGDSDRKLHQSGAGPGQAGNKSSHQARAGDKEILALAHC